LAFCFCQKTGILSEDFLNELKDISEIGRQRKRKKAWASSILTAGKRNLSVATLKCYGERLNDFYNFIRKKSVLLENVDRSVVQEYILSLKDKVSDYTLNGRLRVLKVFFNFLIKEGIWDDKPNSMEKVSYVRSEKKFKPVISIEEMEEVLTVPNRHIFESVSRTLHSPPFDCSKTSTLVIVLQWTELLCVQPRGAHLRVPPHKAQHFLAICP